MPGLAIQKSYARLRRYPLGPVIILLTVLVIPAIFANQLAPYNPLEQHLADRLRPPAWADGGSWKYILGTDQSGRDLLSRMLHGARVSLSVSLIALFVGGAIGTIFGLISGYFGGWVDYTIMRAVDIMMSLPLLLLALVLVTVLGPSQTTTIAVVVILLWSRYARQIRAETLQYKTYDFVARARVAGASDLRILSRHIFPNVLNTLIVIGTLEVGSVILLEATLSFVGAGLPPPTPSWGLMVADGRDYVARAWWVSVVPGLAIMLTVLSMNLLGDWLRDWLDPKLRQV